MTMQVRKGVFETNSSSSHSLTMKPSDVVNPPFQQNVMRKGEVVIGVGEYGWRYERFYSVKNKLRYLLTQITRGKLPEGEDIAGSLREQSPEFAMLYHIVKAQTGVSIVVMPSEGYIDHQSEGVGMELFKDEAGLTSFLFSEESYIETGNDNSGYPMVIPTDRGPEEVFAAFYADAPKDSVPVKLSTPYWFGEFTSKNGDQLDLDSPLMKEVRAQGVVTGAHWDIVSRFSSHSYANKAATINRLVEIGFRFAEDLSFQSTSRKAQKDDEESELVWLTIHLPPELAARFGSNQ